MDVHEKFLKEVIRMACENVESGEGGPFAALVVKDGEIIGRGLNSVTCHNDPTAHAEVMAIREACSHLKNHQLDGCTVYSSCEPCPMCLGAIYWARPEKLLFSAENTDAAKVGFDDSFIYKEMKLPVHERSIPTISIKPADYNAPFELWAKSEKRKEY